MSLLPLFAAADSYDKLWEKVHAYENNGKPQSAYDAAKKILRKAGSSHPGHALCARLKMAELHQAWAPDSFFSDIQQIETMRAAEKKPAARAVYASLLAQLYEMNAERSQAEGLTMTSHDMREWTREQYDSAAAENWRLSMTDLPALSAARNKDWLPFIEQEAFAAYFHHDLLHVLWHRFREQREDNWKGTKRTLASLAKDVVAEYKRTGNREAALLVSLDWVALQDEADDEELLKALKAEYADLPLSTEIVLALMDAVSTEAAVPLGRECIARFPAYGRIGEVRNKLNQYHEPFIDWHGQQVYYPGKVYDWTFTTRNVRRITFEVFAMAKEFRRSNLQGEHDACVRQIREKGQLTETFTFDVPQEQPWKARRDTIAWTAPRHGNYALVFTGEATEPEAETKTQQQYSLFVCSRLQPLFQNGLGQQRTVVVDAESGHPIEGATVEYYLRHENQRIPLDTVLTNAEGRARLDETEIRQQHNKSAYIFCNVRLGDDDFFDPSAFYYDDGKRPEGNHPEATLRLYTDRAIYRPGQTVHIGGILYSQQHWDATVVPDQDVTLILRDANGKEVGTQTVTSDEMGKVSTDFVLPQGGLPGHYAVYARSERGRIFSNVSFRVEEYKRPTFEVTMDEAPDMQWPQDSIILTGKAMGYNGVPVREGRVTGTYQFTYPYWWWKHRDDSERMPFDTLQTDENGCFAVRVPLTRLSEETLWGGLTLQLHVEVLSVAGETQEGSTSLTLCKKPLRLHISVPEQQDRDRLSPVTMSLVASTGRPTDGTVEWSIFPANQQQRTSDEAVTGGTLTSVSKELRFDVAALRHLPAGQYEFYAKATSGEHTDSARAYFLIFGMDDTRLPKVTPAWIYCPDATFSPGKSARIQVGTSFEDVSFYYTIVAGKRVVAERLVTLSDELRVLDIPYEEHFGDGATFNAVFVRGGQVYELTQTLRRVQPQRTLKWEWTSFRDRLRPGQQETWTLRLTRPDGTPAPAQLMATLYDASLDALTPHHWNFFLRYAYNITSLPWIFNNYFSGYGSHEHIRFPMKRYDAADLEFDTFDEEWLSGLRFSPYAYGPIPLTRSMEMLPAPMMMAKANREPVEEEMSSMDTLAADEGSSPETQDDAAAPAAGTPPAPLRTNFSETAAFLPRLTTNAKGEVAISFTLPESLTTWKLLGIAHTADLMTATIEAEAVARKELMARLFLPRFLRADDQAGLRATVQNLTEGSLSGDALLEVFDPATERVILSEKKTFTAGPNGESLLTFDYTPSDAYPVVAVRLTATTASFADGEQHYLPILPSKTYVTQSVEVRADSLGTFATDLSTLFNSDSPTATHRLLTVEYTTHPIWYALQALPSLLEPQCNDIVSLATALQAQTLATYIANTTPRLKALVEIWQREQAQGQPALSSRLAEDEALKQIILDETPWLREAESEADRKARLIQLFDIARQEQTLVSIAERLEKRLETDGGFAWFPGMKSSEVMTRVVASELARLRVMTHDGMTLPGELTATVNNILRKNIGFIAAKTAEQVARMKQQKTPGNTASLMYLQYIYTLQHAGVQLTPAQDRDVKYLLDHMAGSVATMDNWERAMAAIVMKGAGREQEARLYYESLLEHTTTTPDHGTFFDYAGGSFHPTSHKVIHHVAAMEAVHEMAPGNKVLRRNLRRWLLQQKRTQMWESNICTADAIYALLLDNAEALNASQPDDIVLHYATRQVDISRKDADQSVSGLGYIKQQMHDGEAPASITVERHTDSEAWGAVFATFLTPMTDATAAANGLSIRREVNNPAPLVGDKLTTRYVITADRDYEYVCLHADRAACSEPAEPLSGYRYQGGLGYYRAVHDAHTDYFFDHLPKGTYVLEETSFIDRAGCYTTGLAKIQCLYAPEYVGNTGALELQVR